MKINSRAGNVVAGPTAPGVYNVALPTGEHPKQMLASALAGLRARNQVKLANPVAGGGEP